MIFVFNTSSHVPHDSQPMHDVARGFARQNIANVKCVLICVPNIQTLLIEWQKLVHGVICVIWKQQLVQ